MLLCLAVCQPGELKAQIKTDSLLQIAEELTQHLFYRNYDTVYIKGYTDELAVRISALSKYNFFRIADNNQKSSVRYRPDRRINLGFGVSYKWFSFGMSFNLGVLDREKFENSKIFDFNGTVFSSKHFVGLKYQYYLSYKLVGGTVANEDIPEEKKFREDIRTIHFGLDYFYAFNYGKFSLKAPFALNQVQRKSAGSVVTGASFSINSLNADSSMIPLVFYNDFDEKLFFTDINVTTLGIHVGYFYSYVLKGQYFVTLGLIPGLNFVAGDYQPGSRLLINNHLYPKYQIIGAIGYNGRKFFSSLQFISNNDYVRLDKKLIAELGRGKLTLSAGYRFGLKKKNRN